VNAGGVVTINNANFDGTDDEELEGGCIANQDTTNISNCTWAQNADHRRHHHHLLLL
jgi:hypothetical protein